MYHTDVQMLLGKETHKRAPVNELAKTLNCKSHLRFSDKASRPDLVQQVHINITNCKFQLVPLKVSCTSSDNVQYFQPVTEYRDFHQTNLEFPRPMFVALPV
jgi:hypothetical protein